MTTDEKRLQALAEKRARDKANIKAFRRQNVLSGLCACGSPVRPGVSQLGGPYKTCGECGNIYKRYRRHGPVPAPRVRPQRQRPRAWFKLITEHDPEVVTQWRAFCEEYGDINLSEAIEEAMDLFMAVTHSAEGRLYEHFVDAPKPTLTIDDPVAVAS